MEKKRVIVEVCAEKIRTCIVPVKAKATHKIEGTIGE